MEIKQQLRLSQSLVMTPQLQQAIRLLQLSRLELVDEVRKELDNNPVLQDDEPEARGARGENRESAKPLPDQNYDEPGLRSSDAKQTDKAVREVDWEKFLENRTQQTPSA